MLCYKIIPLLLNFRLLTLKIYCRIAAGRLNVHKSFIGTSRWDCIIIVRGASEVVCACERTIVSSEQRFLFRFESSRDRIDVSGKCAVC
jgi:hypothetical protein